MDAAPSVSLAVLVRVMARAPPFVAVLQLSNVVPETEIAPELSVHSSTAPFSLVLVMLVNVLPLMPRLLFEREMIEALLLVLCTVTEVKVSVPSVLEKSDAAESAPVNLQESIVAPPAPLFIRKVPLFTVQSNSLTLTCSLVELVMKQVDATFGFVVLDTVESVP